jgi:cytidylate kinase
MAIVTISHEMGTDGTGIGKTLAGSLGYHFIDQELISDAARRYGLIEQKLTQLDERKPSLFERFAAETRQYITVIQTVLYEFAENDDVVIMGRGGQWLLRDIPHVLRVRVMAPFELRVKRMVGKLTAPAGETVNVRSVADMIRRDDTERNGRMRYLYEVDLGDPALYDVTVNQEKLAPDAASEVLHGLLRRPEFATTDAGRQLVTDRALASRVQVALASSPATRRYRISVEARQGVVTLEGTSSLDQAIEVTRGVPRVREVRTREIEIPPIPPFVA